MKKTFTLLLFVLIAVYFTISIYGQFRSVETSGNLKRCNVRLESITNDYNRLLIDYVEMVKSHDSLKMLSLDLMDQLLKCHERRANNLE